MTKTEMKLIAKKLLIESVRNTSYSLEREEYNNYSLEEIEEITMYMYKYGVAMAKSIGEKY